MRWLTIGVAAVMLALGSVAMAGALAPENALALSARTTLANGVAGALAADSADELEVAAGVERLLDSAPVRWALAPLGLVLLVGLLLPGRNGAPAQESEAEEEVPRGYVVPYDKKAQKKAAKQAASMAKSSPFEAAELCFEQGLMEEAAGYYIKAGDFIRAAEIRHDQNRFVESAELYMQAESYESAGAIFAQQESWDRAAEAYLKAGNQSVAAEMFEKAELWDKAAECYEVAEFPRHAAKAWVRCSEWLKAAVCLEQVIVENSAGAGMDSKRDAETRKLVRMAGDLYVRAGQEEKAEAVLVKGESWGAAAEIALRSGREEKAAELFLRAGEAPRAAKVLQSLGRDADALRVLAEHHRERGEDDRAAEFFEQAQEFVAAGDLYRMLEQFPKAGECYEQAQEFAQAAEMFNTAGDRERAAKNYEQCGHFAEAAECFALVGDAEREAELLEKAGEFLRAGEIYHREGNDDEAIKALQQVSPDDAGFPHASAILGDIFRKRGMHSLARKKLGLAIEGRELDRDTVDAYYGLAAVFEATDSPAEALEIYEKILAFDFHYRDVGERVAACKEQCEKEEAEAKRVATASASQEEGRYRITGKLGRGGMGIVYKAQDTVLDRTVAFKVLPDALKENPQALKNFLREAKSAAQLNHPNIVTVFDAGEQGGVYYIAMEYVDGNTLKEIVKHRGKISAGGLLHVLAQLCEALAYAHEKKIAHRDIKTANIMWTRDRKAKIMDFGLAKAIEEVRNHTTVVSGTPYYMSPEQTLGKNVDHRTDIYSLGVTLFEMATGTLPFREGNLPYHHVHTPPPDPREFVDDLPPFIAEAVNRCLRKDPAERYQSTREILQEIKAASKG
ncbi:MAG: protein kinase [Myxococcota bacterium]|nr:protein kinase [Myxococcota bacterium]